MRARKTRAFRRVTVPAPLAEEIRACQTFRPQESKLVPWDDAHMSNPTLSRMRAKVKGFGTHRCRHAFEFRWLEDRGNVAALQVAMGHASIQTTMIYARPTEALAHSEADRPWRPRARQA